jgi:hypothetical protein
VTTISSNTTNAWLNVTEARAVLTRFRLRSVVYTPLFRYLYKRVRRDAVENVPGLVRSALLFESPTVVYSLSIWRDEASIRAFSQRLIHIRAANWSLRHLARFAAGRIELCTTRWTLNSTSANDQWDGTALGADLTREKSVEMGA